MITKVTARRCIKYTPILIESIKQLSEKELKQREIADKLNINVSTVRNIQKVNKIPHINQGRGSWIRRNESCYNTA